MTRMTVKTLASSTHLALRGIVWTVGVLVLSRQKMLGWARTVNNSLKELKKQVETGTRARFALAKVVGDEKEVEKSRKDGSAYKTTERTGLVEKCYRLERQLAYTERWLSLFVVQHASQDAYGRWAVGLWAQDVGFEPKPGSKYAELSAYLNIAPHPLDDRNFMVWMDKDVYLDQANNKAARSLMLALTNIAKQSRFAHLRKIQGFGHIEVAKVAYPVKAKEPEVEDTSDDAEVF